MRYNRSEMPDYDHHLRFLDAAVEVLESYMLASSMYWPVGIASPAGQPPYPQLTLGSLLLESAFLDALAAGPHPARPPAATRERVGAALERVRTKWRSAWEAKVREEIASRLRQWQAWLNDETEQGRPAPGHYRSGIRLRVMLELLVADLNDLAGEWAAPLAAMDAKLRARTTPGGFVWDEHYRIGFPPQPYWYLYRDL